MIDETGGSVKEAVTVFSEYFSCDCLQNGIATESLSTQCIQYRDQLHTFTHAWLYYEYLSTPQLPTYPHQR